MKCCYRRILNATPGERWEDGIISNFIQDLTDILIAPSAKTVPAFF